MRRLALLAPAAIVIVPSAMAASAAPRAQLAQFACKRALNPIDRSISVQAVMRPVAQTQHMSVRFELRRSTGKRKWVTVNGGGLGGWLTPTDPTLGQNPLDVWMLTKIIRNLGAPERYRFRVRFRWTDSRNRVLRTEKRVSQVCFQPDLRPDLVVKSPISVTAVSKTQARYTAVIRNAGRTDAVGPFEVSLTFPPRTHVAAQTVMINRIGRHKTKSVSFVGPKCTTASVPTVTADPTHVIHDLNRKNNSVQAKCPPLH